MKRTPTLMALACAATLAAVASGCTSDDRPEPRTTRGGAAEPDGASIAPSGDSRRLADRYRAAGGDSQVHGIRHAKGEDGVHLTVWTDEKSGYLPFEDFATGLASFLTGEGVRLDQGYLLAVYGPGGKLLHRYDTTGAHSS
ncbi:hypothetical protein ACIQNU_38465 [Streptomyces sp. NPDC091292]|uniref:hypothetical protein n=1 Tax=Streptomyces sp. NPDC091292 TaxID=3365991 RepID=UPI0037F71BAC